MELDLVRAFLGFRIWVFDEWIWVWAISIFAHIVNHPRPEHIKSFALTWREGFNVYKLLLWVQAYIAIPFLSPMKCLILSSLNYLRFTFQLARFKTGLIRLCVLRKLGWWLTLLLVAVTSLSKSCLLWSILVKVGDRTGDWVERCMLIILMEGGLGTLLVGVDLVVGGFVVDSFQFHFYLIDIPLQFNY